MANRIKGITIEIGGDTTGLDKALKSVNSSIRTTQTALRDVNRLLKLDPSNTELLSQKQKLLKDAIGSTKEKLDALNQAQEQAKQQLESGDLGQDKYDALQREIVETEQQLKKLQEQAIDSNATLAKIEEIGGKLENVGDKVSGVGEKLLPVTAGVTALGTAAVKTTADFDTSMSQVQATMGVTKEAVSTLNGESVNTVEALRALAKQMGSETAYSASECADAMNYLALAGYDTQQIYDTLPIVLNLAASGGIDLASASDMVTDAMSALGVETEEAGTMVDQMAKTASTTNTSVAQLGDGILKIGATAKSVKGGTAELNTALGILANNGIKGAEGGTHLRNIILRLQSPMDKAAKQMEALGLQVYDSEGNMRSLNDILSDLNTSMNGMTSEEKSNIISKIFNSTDIAAVNSLLANTGDTWDDLQQSIADSGGAAQQMADTQLDNLSGQLTILKSALEGLAISFGEMLMPTIRKVVEHVQAFVDKLNSMSEEQRQTVVRILAIVAALGPFLIILGKTISTVGTTMKAFSGLTKGIAKLGVNIAGSSGTITGLGSALSTVATTILPIVAIVGTLVAAFVHLWRTNEDFRNKVTAIWDGLREKFAAFGEAITERLNKLGFDFENITEVISAIWNGFCEVLAPVFEAAFSVISTVIGVVLDVIVGVLDVFIGVFTGNWSQAWDGVKEIFSGIWEGMAGIVSTALELIQGIADAVLGWFGTSWNELWTGVVTFFTGIWEGVSGFFSGVWETMKNVVSVAIMFIAELLSAAFQILTLPWQFIWQNFGDTILAAWETIKGIVSNALEAIKTTISAVWGAIVTVLSPILNTIKTIVTTAFNAVKTVITTVMNGVKTVVSTAWNAVKATVGNAVNNVKTKISSGFNAAKNTVSSIFGSIKNTITSKINAARDTVKSAIERIKSFFNFSWSLPHLKLPHLSISGGFSINPPSVPHFSIDWYAKAMEKGMILNSPTIFGMQGNSLLAGGEAGSETVVGTQSLMDMIHSAVNNAMNGTTINYGGVDINVYAQPGQDIRALADEIEERINSNVLRRRAGF